MALLLVFHLTLNMSCRNALANQPISALLKRQNLTDMTFVVTLESSGLLALGLVVLHLNTGIGTCSRARCAANLLLGFASELPKYSAHRALLLIIRRIALHSVMLDRAFVSEQQWNSCLDFSNDITQSRSQRPRSFWLATGIATSGQVQLWNSAINGLPVTLRMLRVKSDKSDWF